MNYGLPYQGSKSKICEQVCRLFRRADNFYDVFGGGFSITHFMLKHRSNHYKKFHFNELRPGICDLVKNSIDGKYNYNKYSPEWVSREDFAAKKEIDPMIKIVWSFGNNGEDYLFGKDIEQEKKSIHMAIVFNEFDEYAKEIFGIDKFKDGYSITDKRLYLKNRLRLISKNRLDFQQLQQLERLERLQQLERLERLQGLEFYSRDYSKLEIKENSVVYCDPPYRGTADYGSSFNTEKFLDWAGEIKEPVFISEYEIKDKRFTQIASFKKRSLLSANRDNTLIKNERVYVNQSGLKCLRK